MPQPNRQPNTLMSQFVILPACFGFAKTSTMITSEISWIGERMTKELNALAAFIMT